MDLPLVSVVIASHRPEYIGALLAALRLNERVFETIAVCDYAIDRLQREFPETQVYRLDDISISAKRNFGVSKAAAELIAFIDDDCVPAPDWIAKALSFFAANPAIAGVEGQTGIEAIEHAPPALREYRRLERPGFRTNNIFYRKSAFCAAGGFDERFSVQREDIDLAFSIIDKGYTIDHDPAIRVMHRVRRNEPWDLLKNCINRRFDPLLYKKHAMRYREHIKGPFPATLLALLGLHLLAAFALWVGPLLFAAALLVDFVAVTVLALRRCGVRQWGALPGEWLSCLLAPPVLLGALVFGSIRYRKLLLV